MKIQLRGWAAIPAVLLVLAFYGYRVHAVRQSLTAEDLEPVRIWLVGKYTGQDLGALQSAFESGDPDRIQERVDGLVDSAQVQFADIDVRGTEEPVARLRIELNGKEPPDGKSVRYFRLEHSTLFGWRVKREVSAFSYYSKLF